MFARVAVALAALVAGCQTPAPTQTAAPSRGGGVELAQACRGREGWSDPAPPARIAANTYYVGTCGITALLLTSTEGHILIDGATPEAAPHIIASIRRLGFDPRQIRLLLNSHEHVDHAGGLAALKQATGAQFAARAEARGALESGRVDPADPQAGTLAGLPPVKVDRLVSDGEVLRVGPIAVTAHATTGHTAGSTSWSWRACEAGTCRTITYADSLTAVGPETYRFSDHPDLVSRFRSTFDRVARIDCDLLVTPHPSASHLFPRLAGEAPLEDRGACVAYAEGARRRLEERLAREAAR